MKKFISAIATFGMGSVMWLGGVSAPNAEAAIWGCGTGNDSKIVNGVVQYRSWATCYGTPPKGINSYRIKAIFSVLGTGQGDTSPSYGSWVKASSGSKSYSKWIAWPYWANKEGRIVQFT